MAVIIYYIVNIYHVIASVDSGTHAIVLTVIPHAIVLPCHSSVTVVPI